MGEFGLVDPFLGRDACGVGVIASLHNLASRDVLDKAFEALRNLAHRGAVDADGKTGDGSGVMTAIPHGYFAKKAKEQGVFLPESRDYGVMMVFYPHEEEACRDCLQVVRDVLKKYDLFTLWSRAVPVDETVLGQKAFELRPKVFQKFVECPAYMIQEEFEQHMFLARKEIEAKVAELSYPDFYVASMSTKTLVYKGLFIGDEVKNFYLDLQDPDFTSPFAVFHQRFSTNTFPSWGLAQPFRMMAHNGEINTIKGNRHWMRARENAEQARSWVPGDHALKSFIMSGRSDSGTVDNALETYVFAGRSVYHALTFMMPECWQQRPHLDADLRAFYEYHACFSEPWDGPAAVAFCDGKFVGAMVDRNGLRPARYKITRDYLFVCSEMGCVNFDQEQVVANGKLSPGKIIVLNLKRKKVLFNDDVKFSLADQKPYLQWVQKNLIPIENIVKFRGKRLHEEPVTVSDEESLLWQKVFGYTQEDIDLILKPMFEDGKEPLGSMGDDTPLSVFSHKPRLLYTYFKQLFAQVTNPPIDAIRERCVTSLRMYIGKHGNVFEETQAHAKQIRLRSPIMTKSIFDEVCSYPEFSTVVIKTHFEAKEGAASLEDAVFDVCLSAEKAVDQGHIIIVLSDRGVDEHKVPMPMLLAVSAVHHHLIRSGKRLGVSLIVETAEARETHHFACLIGYGASAVYPYLALKLAQTHGAQEAIKNYIQAAEHGLLKIMSKMGISVLQSYHAAQIFEALGLQRSLVKQYFAGTPSKVSGASLKDVASDYLGWHQKAFAKTKASDELDIGGHYRFRRQGEYHAFNPDVVKSLHQAVKKNDEQAFVDYTQHVNDRAPITIRDLLDVVFAKNPIDLKKVEVSDGILKRFCTPGISFGAISQEVHEDFAIAMNRIGAKSDSGEGGEDPQRYKALKNGDSKNSAIKQIASGRFGVTAHYLSQAQEIEIKMAQGAKPGEGGQLPGHKVSFDIARVRHSVEGVTLISPPPHHDIYSIEDLAQLIYDLKHINPKARVCVKLVSEDGIGTIASGVVKAGADVVLISGADGGTGASPLSSIKHTGMPWEIGLAEVQQALVLNSLRDRVVLRVDGGIKTGLDVVKAALLGAEEFGFGTTAMVAVGCVMARKCHQNTCPVGIATQNPDLRKKYTGSPEQLVRFFEFLAQDIRGLLARLGYSSLDDIIGHTELLQCTQKTLPTKQQGLRLQPLLARFDEDKSSLKSTPKNPSEESESCLDDQIIEESKKVIETGKGHKVYTTDVNNTDRSVGAKLSYHIVKKHGPEGLPQGALNIYLKGTVGQSFGVFAARSLNLHLQGEANDYVGKGLSGAVISVSPFEGSRFKPEDSIICGNTCLYGATSGSLFVNGRAGERFAVRNSGAKAVVEGVGEHGCEYMTGGHVLILGSVGENFGAGMTGGQVCVYDPNEDFLACCNFGDVTTGLLDWQDEDGKVFFELLEQHILHTSSPLAQWIRDNWEYESKKFCLVTPKEKG